MTLLRQLREISRARPTAAGTSAPLRLEAIESRFMMTDSFSQSIINNMDGISEFTDYAIAACLTVGGNGDPEGMSTTVLGSQTSALSGHTPWDSTPWNGFDSGWRSICLVADFRGADYADLAVGNDTLSYSGFDFDSASTVYIRAVVVGNGQKVSWDDVFISFYRQGELVLAANIGQGPVADTLGSQTFQTRESILTFTTEATDFDMVVVEGRVRLQAAAGVYPGEDSMFSNIIIQ